jgi:hypothetical protein
MSFFSIRSVFETGVEMLNVGLAVFVETIDIPYREVKSIAYVGVSKSSQTSSTERQRIALRECVRCA